MPNTQLLTQYGWLVVSCTGRYCVVRRNNAEMLFVWRDGSWYQHMVISQG
jgi:hypothetical protein